MLSAVRRLRGPVDREELLAAAFALLVSQGITSTFLQDVCRYAKTNLRAVQEEFPTIDDMFAELYTRRMEATRTLYEEQSKTVKAMAEQGIKFSLEFFLEGIVQSEPEAEWARARIQIEAFAIQRPDLARKIRVARFTVMETNAKRLEMAKEYLGIELTIPALQLVHQISLIMDGMTMRRAQISPTMDSQQHDRRAAGNDLQEWEARKADLLKLLLTSHVRMVPAA